MTTFSNHGEGKKMAEERRPSGIDIVSDVPWGTHLGQFYRTEEDLIDILVPYFKAGLGNNEFCMWVTSPPLEVKAATASLTATVEDLDDYLEKGQIEILDYHEWYTSTGRFESDRVLQGWVAKEKEALANGFDGLRLTGNTFWLEERDWRDFADFEATVDRVIGNYRMIAICSYSLDRCGALEIIEVVNNHRWALVRREGQWELLGSTKCKQAEEALRENEERLSRFMDSATDGFVLLDSDLNYIDINPSALEMVHLERSDFIGKNVLEVVPDIRESGRYDQYKNVVEIGEPFLITDLIPHPTLGLKHVEVKGFKVGDGLGMIFTDITERKQIEQKMVHLERLQTLTEMAAGVSHNLNNMLVSILGSALFLKRKTYDPQVLEEADGIIAGATRIKDLVHRLNQTVRGELEGTLYPVSVNKTVQQVVHSTQPRWKDQSEAIGITIEIVTELEDVPSISGTSSELDDILLNLLLNAVDAIPEGGTITFRTHVIEENVQLTVSDTGKGMDEEARRRMFEPFFTTKEMDFATGLGLTTVHNTMTRWGGSIDVESQPGEGTTFILRFPVWTEPEQPKEETGTEAIQVRSGRVLIVEDDEGTYGLLDRLLSETHEVETVLNGREALEQFAPGQYDVVLIDLGMPGLRGDRVAREMKQVDSVVVAVLITGWDLEPDDPRKGVFDFRIEKPFDNLDEVEDVVARAIELHDRRAGNAD